MFNINKHKSTILSQNHLYSHGPVHIRWIHQSQASKPFLPEGLFPVETEPHGISSPAVLGLLPWIHSFTHTHILSASFSFPVHDEQEEKHTRREDLQWRRAADFVSNAGCTTKLSLNVCSWAAPLLTETSSFSRNHHHYYYCFKLYIY